MIRRILVSLIAVSIIGATVGCGADDHVGYEPGKGKVPPPAPEGAKGGENMPTPGH